MIVFRNGSKHADRFRRLGHENVRAFHKVPAEVRAARRQEVGLFPFVLLNIDAQDAVRIDVQILPVAVRIIRSGASLLGSAWFALPEAW